MIPLLHDIFANPIPPPPPRKSLVSKNCQRFLEAGSNRSVPRTLLWIILIHILQHHTNGSKTIKRKVTAKFRTAQDVFTEVQFLWEIWVIFKWTDTNRVALQVYVARVIGCILEIRISLKFPRPIAQRDYLEGEKDCTRSKQTCLKFNYLIVMVFIGAWSSRQAWKRSLNASSLSSMFIGRFVVSHGIWDMSSAKSLVL